jgi:hypothetical protein
LASAIPRSIDPLEAGWRRNAGEKIAGATVVREVSAID